MAVHLKDDWKPVGKSPSARMLADWMNTVARLFNYASVPSGGTATATPIGFQIEVADRSRLNHSFLPQPSTTEDVWFDVTGGFVLFDGAWESVEAFTIDEDETDTHWWLEIDDASETVDITVESGEAWPTDEGLKFIRLFEFGEAGVLSSITRHATNDVVWTGEGRDQLNHSFRPTQLTATTATMTGGYIHAADGMRYQFADLDEAHAIDFSADTHFWINILYERSSTTNDKITSTGISGMQSGSAFPALTTEDGLTVSVPIMRFVGNSWNGLIRHQTNDIFDSFHSADDMFGGITVDEDGNLIIGDYNLGTSDPVPEDCDQNDHPGDGDYDTGTTEDDDTHPGDNDDGETHPGGGEADEDDTDHPGAADCYTTT
jgi:hypothetical protein